MYIVEKRKLFGYKILSHIESDGSVFYYLKIRKRSILWIGYYECVGEWIGDGIHKPKFIPFRFNSIAGAEDYFIKNINSIIKL